MAAASELYESRVGDVSADRSGFGASRQFAVTIDTIGENPDDILKSVDKVGVGNAVPSGEPHPTRIGLFAAFYVTERRLAAMTYLVRVVYAPPLDFTTPSNPWELSYQPGLAAGTVNHDWRGRPIGPASYRKWKTGDTVEPGKTAAYYVWIPETDKKPTYRQELRRTDAGDTLPVTQPIRLYDVDRTEPVGSFSMTKVFPGMNVQTMASIVMLSNIINRDVFFGFPKRTVKFIGPVAQAGAGIIPDTGTAGYVWRITLAFEWNSLSYRFSAQDELTLDGNQLPVLNASGEPVIRSWDLYPEANLEVIPQIVEQFGAWIQPVEIGLQEPPRGGGRPLPIGGG